MAQTIAFLGLGAMGSRMAARLLAAGHDVRVWNRSAGPAAALAARGATQAASAAAAAEGAQVVISMVRDDAASRGIWLQAGVLRAMAEGAIAIESSTVTPGWIRELAAAAGTTAFIDAPVVGSRPQAEAGQLVYLAGGDPEVVDRARPVLLAMGSAVHHVGPTGAGMAMKLAVNGLFGIQVAALAEILGVLRALDIPDAHAVEILGQMPVTSPALRGIGALIAARRFAPMFPIDLVEKDFACLAEAAAAVGADVPTAAAVRSLYTRARDNARGDENINAVAKLFGA